MSVARLGENEGGNGPLIPVCPSHQLGRFGLAAAPALFYLVQRFVVRLFEQLLHVVRQFEVHVELFWWDRLFEPFVKPLGRLTGSLRLGDGVIDQFLNSGSSLRSMQP